MSKVSWVLIDVCILMFASFCLWFVVLDLDWHLKLKECGQTLVERGCRCLDLHLKNGQTQTHATAAFFKFTRDEFGTKP